MHVHVRSLWCHLNFLRRLPWARQRCPNRTYHGAPSQWWFRRSSRGVSLQSDINQHRCTRTRNTGDGVRYIPFSTRQRQFQYRPLCPDSPRQFFRFNRPPPLQELTLGNTSVHQVVPSRGHFRHTQRQRQVTALFLVLCSHLFPGYDRVAVGRRYRVGVSFRTIDFRLREVCLQGANPLVTPCGWERASTMTSLKDRSLRQKTYSLRHPVANCSCT